MLVLLAVLLVSSGYLLLLNQQPPLAGSQDFSPFEKEIAAFEERLSDNSLALEEKVKPEPKPKSFKFDPNTLSKEGWKALGVEEWLITTIENYRQKGGVFRSKEDLCKIYGMSRETCLRLQAYVEIIPVSEEEDALVPDTACIAAKKEKNIIDINTADENTLQQVRGIGPVFASRIVSYRRLLGGYYHVDQLREVYGINAEVFAAFHAQVTIIDSTLRKININTSSARELMTHPYFNDWNLANAIKNYRDTHGVFSFPEELNNIHLVKAGWLKKIIPYLSTQ